MFLDDVPYFFAYRLAAGLKKHGICLQLAVQFIRETYLLQRFH